MGGSSVLLVGVVGACVLVTGGAVREEKPGPATRGLEAGLRADLGFLASDELHGRGSATRDEHLAALYCAAQLEALGLEGGGDAGGFVQRVALPTPLPRRLAMQVGRAEGERVETWNACGILRGGDARRAGEAVLISAHLDHLGMARAPSTTLPAGTPSKDLIYNGADDDGSGTCAVLALARHLAGGKRPGRTVVFVLFGSEELGGYGNAGFMKHPPVPVKSIVANLEFEMIGRGDPAVPEGTLWLTGFERSNLGPTLAAHGARLVQDPHPEEHFFQRSDNFALARMGIVAHTVSSFGLHKDYHQVSDEIGKIDFPHMVRAIESMEGPVEWLAGSDFAPVWNAGGKP